MQIQGLGLGLKGLVFRVKAQSMHNWMRRKDSLVLEECKKFVFGGMQKIEAQT